MSRLCLLYTSVAINANVRGRRCGWLIAVVLNTGGLILWLALQYGLDFTRDVYKRQAVISANEKDVYKVHFTNARWGFDIDAPDDLKNLDRWRRK